MHIHSFMHIHRVINTLIHTETNMYTDLFKNDWKYFKCGIKTWIQHGLHLNVAMQKDLICRKMTDNLFPAGKWQHQLHKMPCRVAEANFWVSMTNPR